MAWILFAALVYATFMTIIMGNIMIRFEYYRLAAACYIGGFLTILYLATLYPH